MKPSHLSITLAVSTVLSLAAFAGDKDKTSAPMAASSSAQFSKLDTNRDGRISQSEAASDSKLVFATADKNGDGYLDSSEYSQRDMSNSNDKMPSSGEQMPSSTDPGSDASKPRQ
jgi:EF hand domain-containing protein